MLDELYHSLSPIAFSIGPFDVRWYGLGYSVGFVLASILLVRICKRWKITFAFESLLTFLIACMIGTILGARLGFVIFYGSGYYFQNPLEIFAFNQGGMSFHGGLAGFAAGAFIASKMTRMPFGTLADLCGICAPIGLGLVRFANFINGELWGAVTTMPWGVVFDNAGPLPRHPTQIYEAILEGLVLLVVLYILSRRKPPLPRGSYIGLFMLGYAVFRIAVEFIREPDAQLGYLMGTGWVTMGMLLCLPMVFVGIALLYYARRFRLPQAGQEVYGAEPATSKPTPRKAKSRPGAARPAPEKEETVPRTDRPASRKSDTPTARKQTATRKPDSASKNKEPQ